jgi:SAM-dependent methyltransferase
MYTAIGKAFGSEKTFTHTLDPELLEECLPLSARILDYGCGYGRLTAQLAALGYGDVRGGSPVGSDKWGERAGVGPGKPSSGTHRLGAQAVC